MFFGCFSPVDVESYSRKAPAATRGALLPSQCNDVGAHHDALEFPNGKKVLIADLLEGPHATVLQLPASSRRSADGQEYRELSAEVIGSPLPPWQ
jgi:hypothetical protein